MMKYILLFLCGVLTLAAYGQDDPVLFTVEDTEILLSEFDYIYNKNNAKNADYSRESLQEYLDLYIRFKLKVQEAYAQGYDTIPSLKQELEGYRNQLASSFLLDKQLLKRLVDEAYQRKGIDVEVRHILTKIPSKATAKDSNFAFQRALNIKEQLEQGGTFEDLAMRFSDDKTKVNNRGSLGYINGILPKGYYAVETALHALPINEISDPILSPRGYHIIQVLNRREARGQMEISQILIRVRGDQAQERSAKKQQAEELLAQLNNGENFEDLARKYSEDKATSSRGGYIGYVGVGVYEKSFEDAVFALKKDGDFTQLIESTLGYHIIKRVSKKERLPIEAERRSIEAEIKKTERLDLAKSSLLERILQESGIQFNQGVYNNLLNAIDSSFFDYTWAPTKGHNEILFTLDGTMDYSAQEFLDYCFEKKRDRMILRSKMSTSKAVHHMYKSFRDEACLEFEESRLEAKYPEFKALMREYEEGILLFEITKDNVWDKASLDTAGLKEYFEKHRKLYMWDERLSIARVKLDSVSRNMANEIYAKSEKKQVDWLAKKFNKERELISFDLLTLDKGEEEKYQLKWTAGSRSALIYTEGTNDASYTKVDKIIPPTPKSLEDAKGFIIADFQDYLEKTWVENLREKYEVKVNQDVFDQMVKS